MTKIANLFFKKECIESWFAEQKGVIRTRGLAAWKAIPSELGDKAWTLEEGTPERDAKVIPASSAMQWSSHMENSRALTFKASRPLPVSPLPQSSPQSGTATSEERSDKVTPENLETGRGNLRCKAKFADFWGTHIAPQMLASNCSAESGGEGATRPADSVPFRTCTVQISGGTHPPPPIPPHNSWRRYNFFFNHLNRKIPAAQLPPSKRGSVLASCKMPLGVSGLPK